MKSKNIYGGNASLHRAQKCKHINMSDTHFDILIKTKNKSSMVAYACQASTGEVEAGEWQS